MYKNFRGTISEVQPARCMSFGECAILDEDSIEITELPPTIWTDEYKNKLMAMCGGNDDKGKPLPVLIEDYENHSSHDRVKFIVKLSPAQMIKARKDGYHNYFNLTKSITYANTMTFFDALGKLTCYKSTTAIAKVIQRYYYFIICGIDLKSRGTARILIYQIFFSGILIGYFLNITIVVYKLGIDFFSKIALKMQKLNYFTIS
jgi:hypothetical protein